MVRRLHSAFATFAAVALLTLGALSIVTRADASAAAGDHVVAMAKSATITRTTPSERAPRPLTASQLLVAAGAVAMAMATVASHRRANLLGPLHRRIDDVGEDWRSLLLGAPPISA